MPDDTTPESRRDRLLDSAADRGVPLAAILTTVAVVVTVYLAGKLVYKLREILLLMVVAGFIALLLNPGVVLLQRWKVKRRGLAVAIVTVLFVLAMAGLAALFGYPLVNGLTHLTHKLPTYVKQVEQGKGALGRLARKYHVQQWVDKNLVPKLSTVAKNLSKPALTLGKAAVEPALRSVLDLRARPAPASRRSEAASGSARNDAARTSRPGLAGVG